jgi:hypothetical protein
MRLLHFVRNDKLSIFQRSQREGQKATTGKVRENDIRKEKEEELFSGGRL